MRHLIDGISQQEYPTAAQATPAKPEGKMDDPLSAGLASPDDSGHDNPPEMYEEF